MAFSLPAKSRVRVANATVRLTALNGQGVLVPGGFILTATHCIEWSGRGGMALGDHYREPIETRSGARFAVGPWAADPVSDIAVLGELDNQVFSDDADAFEDWREQTKPVWLRTRGLPAGGGAGFRVHVLTHRGEWRTGMVRQYGHPLSLPSATLALEMRAGDIRCGTSGGPVVDDAGRLVGVVSHTAEGEPGATVHGVIPVACLALPRWALLRIAQDAVALAMPDVRA